jgi:hypothetical protein|tara:strand:+ start:2556 stop:2672 length:117 start_codon:yes stop_codon:yes gene_type:complete
MEKENKPSIEEDSKADAIAWLAIIAVIVTAMVYWVANQ